MKPRRSARRARRPGRLRPAVRRPVPGCRRPGPSRPSCPPEGDSRQPPALPPWQGLLIPPTCGPAAAVALAVACCPAVADGELHEVGLVPGMGAVPGEELSWMARNTATAAITTAAAAITISRRDHLASRCFRKTTGWLLGCV